MRMALFAAIAAPVVALTVAVPAHAALPAQLRAMLDAAIASGNAGDVDTLAKYLKGASPADGAEIDRIIADHRARLAAAREEKLRHQGLMDGWHGEGQIGAFQSTGNTSSNGVAVGVHLAKEGIHWRYGLRALADYQRQAGITSRNQQLVAFEPDYKFNDRLFAFGLAQYERDRFAGFTARTTLSGGLGYRLIADPALTVDVKAGPAWRRTTYLGLPATSSLAGLGALDAAWKVSPSLALTENATVVIDRQNTALSSLTALTAKMSSALSARLSYQVTNNSAPPAGIKQTDTLTRMTLVYGF